MSPPLGEDVALNLDALDVLVVGGHGTGGITLSATSLIGVDDFGSKCTFTGSP